RSISYHSALLHQNTPKTILRSITIYREPLRLVWQSQGWRRSQPLLQLIKGPLTLISPYVSHILLQQRSQRLRDLGEILNEPPIISSYAQERPDFLYCLRCL